MCYVLQEGVVLGADSTTSTGGANFHYFNHNQKLFEVGENGTLGVITWGWAAFAETSYRTLIADFSEDLLKNIPKSVGEVADRWASYVYSFYVKDPLVVLYSTLGTKAPHDPAAPATPGARTLQEQDVFTVLTTNLVVGFCVAGRVAGDRTPMAFHMHFEPAKAQPVPNAIPMGGYLFWGVPNMADRLLFGADQPTREAIVSSPLWSGTRADLDALLTFHHLQHSALPIRDAVDFVHMCIQGTIKALKFSAFSQVCGGPIEIAAITTDRPFRWVKHKKWNAALLESDT